MDSKDMTLYRDLSRKMSTTDADELHALKKLSVDHNTQDAVKLRTLRKEETMKANRSGESGDGLTKEENSGSVSDSDSGVLSIGDES